MLLVQWFVVMLICRFFHNCVRFRGHLDRLAGGDVILMLARSLRYLVVGIVIYDLARWPTADDNRFLILFFFSVLSITYSARIYALVTADELANKERL